LDIDYDKTMDTNQFGACTLVCFGIHLGAGTSTQCVRCWILEHASHVADYGFGTSNALVCLVATA